jgi:hypothetical protein
MSCICTSQQYIDQNGNIQNITEAMCVEIIADNPACCDNFDFSCYKKIYFDTTSLSYVGCKNCQNENISCCEEIQNYTNYLNPNKDSNCCENFDSYCIEAKNVLEIDKNSSCYVSNEESTDNSYSTFTVKSGIDPDLPPLPEGATRISCPGPDCPVGLICDSCSNDGSFSVIQYQCGCPGQEETRYACPKYCIGLDLICRECSFELDPVDQLGCQPCTYNRICPEACDVNPIPENCECLGCDLNYGYTSYTATPEVFMAVWSPPWASQQRPDENTPECEDACSTAFGSCGTITKETYSCEYAQSPQQCPGAIGDTQCVCYDLGFNSAAYTRFSSRKFRYNESGIQNTSIKATDEELIRYRQNNIKTGLIVLQGNCRKCCNPGECSEPPPQELESFNTDCVTKQMDPEGFANNCYGMRPDGSLFSNEAKETAVAIIKNIQAGKNSTYLGCVDCPIGDPTASISGWRTSGVGLIDSQFCNYEQPITYCQNQNYVYGKPLPPEGITGVFKIFDAPHKYELFSEECCSLIDRCFESSECASQYGSGCNAFMSDTCETRAFRFCIHDGCSTLPESERSSQPFVHYYQGVSAGDDPFGGSDTINQNCFHTYSLIDGRTYTDNFGDSTTITISGRSSLPPQQTGTCFDYSGAVQFNCIKLMADISELGNPKRDAVINYFKNYLKFDISSYLDDCFCSHMDVVDFSETGQSIPVEYPYVNPNGVKSTTPKLCQKVFDYENGNENLRTNNINYLGPFIATQGQIRNADLLSLSADGSYVDASNNDFVAFTIASPQAVTPYSWSYADSLNSTVTDDYNVSGLITNNEPDQRLKRNPCTPCHGFVPLYHESNDNGFILTNEYLNLQGYSKYKFYGNIHNDDAYKKIIPRKTLIEQIETRRVYNREVCEFIQAIICSGIEVLHITEPKNNVFYTNQNFSSGLTGPVDREILSSIYGSGIFTDYPLTNLPNYLELDTYTTKVIPTNNLFNVNIGVCRVHPPSPEDSTWPRCEIPVFDAEGNQDDCDNVNEIVMAGRCYSGPVVSKILWDGTGQWIGFDSYFNNFYGYTGAQDKTFKEWITSVSNLDENIPNTGKTIRSLFYEALRTGMAFINTASTQNTTHEKLDEERYLDITGLEENPYIKLETLKSHVAFEQCYDTPTPPTFESINKPCLSDPATGVCSIVGGCNGLEDFLNLIAAQCSSCGGTIDFCSYAASPNSQCAIDMAAFINSISTGCVTSGYIQGLLQQLCDAESNPCSFKFNNKRYRQKR